MRLFVFCAFLTSYYAKKCALKMGKKRKQCDNSRTANMFKAIAICDKKKHLRNKYMRALLRRVMWFRPMASVQSELSFIANIVQWTFFLSAQNKSESHCAPLIANWLYKYSQIVFTPQHMQFYAWNRISQNNTREERKKATAHRQNCLDDRTN